MDNRFLGLIEVSIKTHWELPALTDYRGHTFYYKDAAREMAKMHLLFEQAGIRKGDRIALAGRNSSRWVISFFGILSYGAVAVPILHEFKAENIHHIVNHSGARILIAAAQNRELLNVQAMPDVQLFLAMEDGAPFHSRIPDFRHVYEQLDALFARKYPGGFTPEQVRYHVEQPDELAILNYTSGTTGFSKGVMLPYRSLWSNTQYAYDCLPFVHAGDSFVSVLPMAHMYGLAFEIMNGINKGCHIHFLPRVPNPGSVIESLRRNRPKLIIAVPLIIEKIVRNNIFPVLRKPVIRTLYRLPVFRQIINGKIRKQLNDAFGGNCFEIVIGGAAMNREIETFLHSLRFRYTIGYGMTECGPLIAYEQWDTFRQGSVGRIVNRMEVKIDSADPEHVAGEIMVRGMNNMLGYYRNPEATAEIMSEDGWMRTGDLGTLDRDGFLFIRGRCKTMILSSNGQNIYPEEIESLLNELPYVSESLVVMNKGLLYALVCPEWEKAAHNGLSDDDLTNLLREDLKQVNRQLPGYSRLADVKLLRQAFEKTPKQSIKRFLYQEEYFDINHPFPEK
ncbi:MAG: AMP-binding protein [Tannerella sp.]|jgi:long-chain acyl-CoA synthetase|nr:AMP-binding protein [Tannerella sp.]